MRSTTTCKRGEIALVRFVFADEEGAKRRPVLVLSTEGYHRGRADLIVAALTSNIARLLPGDHLIARWREAGLPKPSVVTAVLRTIKTTMIERSFGVLDRRDLRAYTDGLRPLIGM
jgi:mRNA interferase MazF